ncbi:MAG: two-component system, OmpR family, response regulator [Acidobacteriota bacterium]|jgi:two-component system copper resistance phosphate regulon response regulator CusR|nr:two-component system, OmpR family, response regulator [Acidobacteriota bacterium]MDT5262993.1 two-component system, OmpR family, response regulator [Acidobacteriota bacterium]MDT7777792.1 two-component system, OmpR family, response regulator [Acidobacteriota bacterium]
MRILLAEDDPDVARIISKGLREHGYAVDVADDGSQALYNAAVHSYDLAILDVKLPAKDGFSVCRELREKSFRAPVLLLTGMDDVEDIICGLNCGADDYLTKPFDFTILLARLRALLRRAQLQTGRPQTIEVADLKLNILNHTASRGGRLIRLTAKEYALLEMLMLHPGQILGREAIAEHVWENDFDPFSNVIDVYVNRLRKKIDEGFERSLLHTSRGEGYMISSAPAVSQGQR